MVLKVSVLFYTEKHKLIHGIAFLQMYFDANIDALCKYQERQKQNLTEFLLQS